MDFKIKSIIPDNYVQKAIRSKAANIARTEKQPVALKQKALSSSISVVSILGLFAICRKPADFIKNTAKLTNFNAAGIKFRTRKFVNEFLKGHNKELDKVILTTDFTQYGKSGLPLSYSRKRFINDIKQIIKHLSEERQGEILSQFNLYAGKNDIDGIPVLIEKIDNSAESQKLKSLIEKFCYKNETTFTDTKLKHSFDVIIKGFPEFNMAIGKVQHGTHIYSVDIHSLLVLQKSMKNPEYKKLSDEGKTILKFSALSHDFGKKGNVITPGHALISKKYVTEIIDKYNLPAQIKDRILNQIEHHHWFQAYNRGEITAENVKNIFKTPEDLKIAKILAKSDFESISQDFHLQRMNPEKILSQSEFDAEYAAKTAKIRFNF